MKFWTWVWENKVKIMGVVSAVLMQVMSMAASGQLDAVASMAAITWIGIIGSILGVAITAAGFSTTAAVRMEQARAEIATAMAAKQGGKARPGILALMAALTAILVMTFQGCALLGVPSPEGFNERLAAGYSSVTSVRDSALTVLQGRLRAIEGNADLTDLERSEKATAARQDAQNLQDQADSARAALDAARSLQGISFDAAEERLASTLRIIQALQQYLEEQD